MKEKDYLKGAMEIEKSLYEQGLVIGQINGAIDKLRNVSYKGTVSEHSIFDGLTLEDIFYICLCPIGFGIVGVILSVIASICSEGIIDGFFKASISATISKPFIIGCICGAVILIGGFIYYGISTTIENKEIRQLNVSIIKNNTAIKEVTAQKMTVLQEKRKVALANYEKTKKLLNTYYNCGILHPKYRNFVAVASIYEYFSSGICDKLTGHEGAYNKYDQESRLNCIITKLDVVIQKLDQIRDNQYELYSAVRNVNTNVNKVTGGLNTLIKTTKAIENCAELTEYNSMITANNTEFTKWVQVFEHL